MDDNKKFIADLQKEASELGLDPMALEGEESPEDSMEDDSLPLDGEPDALDKKQPKAEDDKKDDESEDASKGEEEEKPPVKDPKDIIREQSQMRAERRANRIKDLETKFAGIETALKNVVGLLEKNKGQEAEDKLSTYAKKHGLDAEGIKELVGIIKEEVGDKKVKPEEDHQDDPAPEKKSDSQYDEQKQKEIFESEWDELMPEIEQQFPKANAAQVIAAKKLMDEISHSSQKLAAYDLVDILNSPSYKQKFRDLLFTPKERTFEAGRTVERGNLEENVDFDNLNISTPEAAKKAQDALFARTGGNSTRMFKASGGQAENID